MSDECKVCELGSAPCRDDVSCRFAQAFTPEVIAGCGRALVGAGSLRSPENAP